MIHQESNRSTETLKSKIKSVLHNFWPPCLQTGDWQKPLPYSTDDFNEMFTSNQNCTAKIKINSKIQITAHTLFLSQLQIQDVIQSKPNAGH